MSTGRDTGRRRHAHTDVSVRTARVCTADHMVTVSFNDGKVLFLVCLSVFALFCHEQIQRAQNIKACCKTNQDGVLAGSGRRSASPARGLPPRSSRAIGPDTHPAWDPRRHGCFLLPRAAAPSPGRRSHSSFSFGPLTASPAASVTTRPQPARAPDKRLSSSRLQRRGWDRGQGPRLPSAAQVTGHPVEHTPAFNPQITVFLLLGGGRLSLTSPGGLCCAHSRHWTERSRGPGQRGSDGAEGGQQGLRAEEARGA